VAGQVRRCARCLRASSAAQAGARSTSAAIARPISTVEALPPRSALRGPCASTVSIAPTIASWRAAARALTFGEEVEHQRGRPDHRDRVGDVLAGYVGR